MPRHIFNQDKPRTLLTDHRERFRGIPSPDSPHKPRWLVALNAWMVLFCVLGALGAAFSLFGVFWCFHDDPPLSEALFESFICCMAVVCGTVTVHFVMNSNQPTDY